MEDKERLRVLERIRGAEEWRDSNYRQLWQECRRRYRSQPAGPREGSNIFVPQTFMQCEVIRARLCESLFSQRPYVAALPREDNDVERASKLQTLLDWQLNDRVDLPRLVGETILAGMIVYGTGIAYTGWQLRRRQVRRLTHQQRPVLDAAGQPLADEAGQPLTLPVSSGQPWQEVWYDDPLIANIPLEDFFCDTRAADLEEARFCGHREYQTRSSLEQLAAEGKYQIDWEHLQPLDQEDEAFWPQEQKGLLLVHHYWEDERHLVFINRDQLALEEPNPFWHGMKPYDRCCYVPLPGEFYGLGVPEILAGLQDELNTSRNQRIDYNSLSLRRMWKLRRGCGLAARDLIWRQNGVLQVENMDDVQEISLQNLPPEAFANEAGIKQDMQDATGCYDVLMGAGYAQETATTTLTRDNNASLRFKANVRNVVKDLILPIAKKCVSMDQQFLSGQRLLRVLGEEAGPLFSLNPEEIAGDYDVIYCGAAIDSLANKELAKERALQAYSLALADPAYREDDGARLRLFQKVLAGLEIKGGPELLPQTRPAAQPLPEAAAKANLGGGPSPGAGAGTA